MGGRGFEGGWLVGGGSDVDARATWRAEVGVMFMGSTRAAVKSASRGGTAVLLVLGPRRRLVGGSEVAFVVDVFVSDGCTVVDVCVVDASVAGSVAV